MHTFRLPTHQHRHSQRTTRQPLIDHCSTATNNSSSAETAAVNTYHENRLDKTQNIPPKACSTLKQSGTKSNHRSLHHFTFTFHDFTHSLDRKNTSLTPKSNGHTHACTAATAPLLFPASLLEPKTRGCFCNKKKKRVQLAGSL